MSSATVGPGGGLVGPGGALIGPASGSTQTNSFAIGAVIQAERTGSLSVDAVVTRNITGAFDINAWANATLAFDAVINRTTEGSFTADAELVQPSFAVDAVIRSERTGSLTVDGFVVVPPGFSVDARIAGAIPFNAILQRTTAASFSMSAETILPRIRYLDRIFVDPFNNRTTSPGAGIGASPDGMIYQAPFVGQNTAYVDGASLVLPGASAGCVYVGIPAVVYGAILYDFWVPAVPPSGVDTYLVIAGGERQLPSHLYFNLSLFAFSRPAGQWRVRSETSDYDFTPTPSTWYRACVEFDGTNERIKVWPSGAPEPSVWAVETAVEPFLTSSPWDSPEIDLSGDNDLKMRNLEIWTSWRTAFTDDFSRTVAQGLDGGWVWTDDDSFVPDVSQSIASVDGSTAHFAHDTPDDNLYESWKNDLIPYASRGKMQWDFFVPANVSDFSTYGLSLSSDQYFVGNRRGRPATWQVQRGVGASDLQQSDFVPTPSTWYTIEFLFGFDHDSFVSGRVPDGDRFRAYPRGTAPTDWTVIPGTVNSLASPAFGYPLLDIYWTPAAEDALVDNVMVFLEWGEKAVVLRSFEMAAVAEGHAFLISSVIAGATRGLVDFDAITERRFPLDATVRIPPMWAAGENETFIMPEDGYVYYGASGNFNHAFAAAGATVVCSAATFGDPIYGTVKACYIQPRFRVASDIKASPTSSFTIASESATTRPRVVLVDAVIRRNQSGSFQIKASSLLAAFTPTGSFTLDTFIVGTLASFLIDAQISSPSSFADDFTVDAWASDTYRQDVLAIDATIARTPREQFDLDAEITLPVTPGSGSFTVDAYTPLWFALNAFLARTFTLAAEIVKPGQTFTLAAETKRIGYGWASIDAVIARGYVPFDAVITAPRGDMIAFLSWIELFLVRSASFSADAVIVEFDGPHDEVDFDAFIVSSAGQKYWPPGSGGPGNPGPVDGGTGQPWRPPDRQVRIQILIDNVDVTRYVELTQARFTQAAANNPGTFMLPLRGAFPQYDGGEEVIVLIDGFRQFGGFVRIAHHDYHYPYVAGSGSSYGRSTNSFTVPLTQDTDDTNVIYAAPNPAIQPGGTVYLGGTTRTIVAVGEDGSITLDTPVVAPPDPPAPPPPPPPPPPGESTLPDMPGWHLVFYDEYDDRTVIEGHLMDGSTDNYHTSDGRYIVFKSSWTDTSGHGHYDPTVASIHDSMLDIHLHTRDGFPRVFAMTCLPQGGSAKGGVSGPFRRLVRARGDFMVGYKGVPLLWADLATSNAGLLTYGEIDFPESDYNARPKGYVHHINAGGSNPYGDQDVWSTPTGTTWQDWHDYLIDYRPGQFVEFFMDGVSIGKSTSRVPYTAMHANLQFETQLDGGRPIPSPSVDGHVYVDRVAIWVPD